MHPTLNELLPALPSGYSSRQHTVDDAQAFLSIVQKLDIHACGETSTTLEEMIDDLADDKLDNGAGGIAVLDSTNRVVAIVNAFNELSLNRGLFADVFIDPTIDTDIGKLIGDAVVRATVSYSQQIAAQYPDTEPFIRTGLYATDEAFLHGLRSNGFEQSRILWRMRIDHERELHPPVVPQGVTFEDFNHSEDHYRQMHFVQMEAFREYHDFRPKPYEEWRAQWADRLTEDPHWWRLATVNGKVIGLCQRTRRFESAGFGYIGSLGVLSDYRGRGIARALLHDAFYWDQRNGLNSTLLHGDSTNPTGAMVLYQSVGMRTDREYLAYRLSL